jgi:hypothetical protein
MERLRDRVIAAGLSQRGVNACQRLLRSAARWAAAEERLTHKPLPVVRLRSSERVNSDYTPTEAEALATLRELRADMRQRIARDLRMRKAPTVSFAIDDSIANGARISELLTKRPD